MNYNISKAEFEHLAEAYDICSQLNGCETCRASVHCKQKWNQLVGETVPFNYFPMRKENPYPSKSESRYDTKLVTAVLKRRGFNDDTLLSGKEG
jgi:hypothetical protein